MLKIWDVDGLAKRMPSRLLTEWIAFMRLENEDMDQEIKQANLAREAEAGVRNMRAKRGRR